MSALDVLFKMVADLSKTVFAAAGLVLALSLVLDVTRSQAPASVVLMGVGGGVGLIYMIWLTLKKRQNDESNEHI